MLKGRFHIRHEDGREEIVDNQIVDSGLEAFLKMIFQAATADVSNAGNFYLGICGSSANDTDTLVDVQDEPLPTCGYARQAIARSAIGWPTVDTVNGYWRALSQAVTFAATTGSFTEDLIRLFLCNVASGTSGKLFAYSKALTNSITITAGNSYSISYEVYLDS